MRLPPPQQAQAIGQRVRACMDQHARNWLCGSRADDHLRGGDADLYFEPETVPDLVIRLRCSSDLTAASDLKFDLIVQSASSGFAQLSHCQRQRSRAVTDRLNLIRIKLQHLSRVSECLTCSLTRVGSVLKSVG